MSARIFRNPPSGPPIELGGIFRASGTELVNPVPLRLPDGGAPPVGFYQVFGWLFSTTLPDRLISLGVHYTDDVGGHQVEFLNINPQGDVYSTGYALVQSLDELKFSVTFQGSQVPLVGYTYNYAVQAVYLGPNW